MAVISYVRYALTSGQSSTSRPAGAFLYFYCDTEAELPSGAAALDGDGAYTVDTKKRWQRAGGAWALRTEDSVANRLQDASGDIFFVNDLTDGQFLKRSGANIVSEAVAGGGDLLAANNLSDLANAGTARTNLGLGTAATTAATDYATAAQGAKADTALQNVSTAWPVGSVFISVVSTNPATLLGFGTWSAFAAGRMLVGLDSGDTDFDTVEEVGGAKTKTIAQANLPNISTGAGTAHTHIQDAHTHTQNSHNHTQDAHTHSVLSQTATTGSAESYEHGTKDTSSAAAENANPGTGSTVATNQAATATNQNATATNQNESSHTHSLGGSGTALNVVNPYIVVYMWKRTA